MTNPKKSHPTATNQLAEEKSPYLLQHAHNPVNWHPWGEEAFNLARSQKKPIFLSIGYSTCHWCHVMERESFEDEETAALLNETFVCIKVDREERPDIDSQYMTVCQMMNGLGGWPLTLLLTPDKTPFFAGTYFPRESQGPRMGLKELVTTVAELWETRKGDLEHTAQEVASKVATLKSPHRPLPLEARALHRGFLQLQSAFDDEHAGFGGSRKFPTPHNLLFLLRHWKRTRERGALDMVEKTLDAMIRGGIHDHVGGGFHRYSTDREWKLPHFEKMLYDQALMAIALLEAYAATGKERYARAARGLFGFVQRELRHPRGGFYTAQDADSDGEEGRFYVWSVPELRGHLSERELQILQRVFDLSDDGNFRDEATRKRTGANVLHRHRCASVDAEELGFSEAELEEELGRLMLRLRGLRDTRTAPDTDDKVLTDINGLMIAAFARGARVLGDTGLALTASKSAEFLWRELRVPPEGESSSSPTPRLHHRWRDGETYITGFLDDYAFFAWGLTELYEATFDPKWLRRAVEISQELNGLFADEKCGGYFTTPVDGESILARPKEFYDGAVPAGNSVAAHALLRLSRLTGRGDLETQGRGALDAASAEISGAPAHHTFSLLALSHLLGPSFDVVVAGDSSDEATLALLEPLSRDYLPHTVTLFRPTDGDTSQDLQTVAPFTEHYGKREGSSTAYVCRDGRCELPTTEPEVMLKHLQAGSRAKPLED